MKTEDITQAGYYWVWIGEWRVVRHPEGFWPSPDGSMAGRDVIGPIEPPKHSPERMAEMEAERKERQKWGIQE